MSREITYVLGLRFQRNQEIINERIRSTTMIYYERYIKMYESFVASGFEKFIPDEMNRLKNDLDSISQQLADNPNAARSTSLTVQQYIYTLSSLGEAAKKKFQYAERMAMMRKEAEERARMERDARERKERQNEIVQVFYAKIASISNPAVQNFISDDLEQIKHDISEGKFETVESIENTISEAVHSAEQKADEWKAEILRQNADKTIKSKIEAEKERIATEKIENLEKKAAIIRKLDDILSRSSAGSVSTEEIEQEISAVSNETVELTVSEDVRREAVRSIIRTLRAQDFIVDPNIQLIPDGDGNFVRIIAKKPSGKQAVCDLTNKGRLIYRFDNYEGMACLKDIERFNVELQEIYSLKLSDERILWSNPDRIGKDEEKLPDSEKING